MSNATRVEALFFAAQEKGPADERAAYLDSACGGDAELRRQVEKRLNAHPTVGDFRIIRVIGHGGMGVVYEAEQVSLGRHVALKVLPRQLLADSQTKRRF